jgi:hypothetical protein
LQGAAPHQVLPNTGHATLKDCLQQGIRKMRQSCACNPQDIAQKQLQHDSSATQHCRRWFKQAGAVNMQLQSEGAV